MKKRFISCFILLAMLLGIYPLGVFSASQSDLALNVEREDVDGVIYHTYTVSGSLPAAAGKEAKMIAYRSGTASFSDSTVQGADQTTVAADGTFSFRLILKDEGTYIVEVKFNGLSNMLSAEIVLKENSYYSNIIDLFNDPEVTASALQGYISAYADALAFNTTFFDKLSENTGKPAMGSRMKKYVGNYTFENINSIYNNELVLEFIKDKKTVSDITMLIAMYDNIGLEISNQDGAKNIYSDFLDMKNNVQTAIVNLFAGKSYTDFNAVRTAFNEAALIGAFNNMNNSEFLAFMKNNNDYLQLAELDTISDLRADTVLNLMKNSSAITTKAAFITAFKNAYSNSAAKLPVNTGMGVGASNPSGGSTSISTDQPTKPDGVDTQAVTQTEFTDLDSVLWAKDAILELYRKGIVKGKANGIYAPGDNITREEFAKIIIEAFDLLDETSRCDFTDVSETDWSYSYIASAKKYELIKGYEDGSFNSKANITRQDMAVIIYRTLVTLKKMESYASVKTDGLFADEQSIANYAKNSVIMLNNASLIMGNDKNEFLPLNNATRAEVAVLISRVLQYVE